MEHPHDDHLGMSTGSSDSGIVDPPHPRPHRRSRFRGASSWRRGAAAVTALGTLITGLVMAPALQMLSSTTASANDFPPPAKVADPSTATQYPGASNPDYLQTSDYKGRIWTDKSVSTSSMTVGTVGTGTSAHIVDVGQDELGVTLSALGSSRSVLQGVSAPVDLSLILSVADLMAQCIDPTATADGWCNDPDNYTGSRAYAMAQGVEQSIETLASSDSRDRVGIVAFANTSSVLFALNTPAKISGTNAYVQLLAPTTTNGTMTLKTANNSVQIGPSGSEIHASNLQLGLVAGMNLLANQTSANVSGANQRLPEVIVFTSSAPTLSSNAGSLGSGWWKVTSSTAVQGPGVYGDPQFYGNALLAVLAASFLKNKIATVYNNPTYNAANNLSPITPGIYTIGMDLSALGPLSERPLAQAALDPAHVAQQQASAASGAVADFIARASDYTTGHFVQAQVSASGSLISIGHPGDAPDTNYDPTSIAYNTAFYSPLTAADASAAFQNILSGFATPPTYPSEIEGGASPAMSGYVTFTDPIGPFMQVRDLDSVTFCVPASVASQPCKPTTFVNPTTSDLGNGLTQYTFSGTVAASVIAGPTSVSELIVTVQQYDTLARGDVVTMKVPAALLPVRYETVMTTASGTPVALSMQDAQPMHLDYVVGPKPGVMDALSNPDSLNSATSQDGTFLRDYIASHSSGGQVRFYSNDYSVATDGSVQASTSASWVPSDTNDFYRFSVNTPLYADSGLTTPLTSSAWAGLASGATIWYYVTEYRYTDATQTAIKADQVTLTTTKAQLQAAMAAQPNQQGVVASGGAMVVSAGTLDFARNDQLNEVKCLTLSWSNGNPVCNDTGSGTPGNLSGTAIYQRQTTYASTTVQVALGNDGYLSFILPSTLTITPTVAAASTLHPAVDQEFPVHVTLTNADGSPFTHPVDYAIFSAKDLTTALVGAGGSLVSTATLSLQAGQVAVLQVPQGVTYTVTEDVPAGYTLSSSSGTTGTTTATTQGQATFVNTYQPTTATVAQGPQVSATLDGTDWQPGQTFTVQMCPDGGTMSQCQSQSLSAAAPSATFPGQTFTTPGTYVYTMSELPESAIEGVSYSDALYVWTVTVTDDGHGALQASGVLTRSLDDGGESAPGTVSQATFANVSTESAYRAQLIAAVLVDDQSTGQVRIPTHSYNFAFSYVGVDLQDSDADTTGLTPPAFDGATSVMSSGSVIVGPGVLLTEDQVGHTWYFKAQQADTTPSPAVTNSNDVWFRAIDLEQNDDGMLTPVMSNCHTTVDTVTADNPLGGCAATVGSWGTVAETQRQFIITYSPDATTTTAYGDVTLQGRPWQDSPSDNLKFEVTPNDAVTTAAVDAGWIQPREEPLINVTYANLDAGSTNTAALGFAPFHYTRQGTYQFAVDQIIPSTPAPGVTYDTHTAVVDVVVGTSSQTGQLSVTVTVRDNQPGDTTVHFVNRYRASMQFADMSAALTLNGRAIQLGEFAFTVTADDAASCSHGMFGSTCTLSVTNGTGNADPSQTVLDSNFRFTQADLGSTFGYTVTQANTGRPGVTYDTSQYHVTLQPRYDPTTGGMYVMTSVSQGDAVIGTYDSRTTASPALAFHDSYRVQAGTADPTFSLGIIGRGWNSDDSFTFAMSPLSPGAPPPPTSVVTLTTPDQASNFDFGSIPFTQAGTYRYSVSQVVPTDRAPGLTYDRAASIATVTVTDTGVGQLQTAVAYDGNEDFVNSYRTVVSVNLGVSTVLQGMDATPGMFAFQLVPKDGSAANAADLSNTGLQWTNAQAQPAGVPEVMYPLNHPLRFTQDDSGQTFTYEVSQADSPNPVQGVVYDQTDYTMAFTVQDDNSGVLTVTTTVSDSSGVVSTFTSRSTDATTAVAAAAPIDPHVDFVNTYSVAAPPVWTVATSSWPLPGSSVRPGDKIRFSMTVTPGAQSTSGVVVTSDLAGVLGSATLSPDDITAPDGTTARLDGTTLVWNVGTLSAPLTLNYLVTVSPTALGNTLTSSVTGDSSGSAPDQCGSGQPCELSYTVTADATVPSWALTMVSAPVSGSKVPAGGTITYTLTAAPSNGVVSDAVVVDDLSGVLAHATLGPVDAPAGTKVVVDGSTLTWTIGDLSGPLVLTYRVTTASNAGGMALSSAFWGQGSDTGSSDPVALPPVQCTVATPCTTVHQLTTTTSNTSPGGVTNQPGTTNNNNNSNNNTIDNSSSVPTGGTPGDATGMLGAVLPYLAGVFMVAALICGSTLLRRTRERHSLG